MPDQPQGQPFHESNLDSPEYRERLMRKLNTLIALLEVAGAKVRRSLSGPAPDVQRLMRIRKNLQDTLEVCLRAKTALQKRGSLPKGISRELSKVVNPDLIDATRLAAAPGTPASAPRRRGVLVEMSSAREAQRFRDLGRIDPTMVWSCDIDELMRRLQG